MKCKRMLFLLFFIPIVLYQNIKSGDSLVNHKSSIKEGVWKRKVGRPKKNAPIEYFRVSASQAAKKNAVVVMPKSKELVVVQNGLLKNSTAVVNALPKKWLTLPNLSRKGLIGAVLGIIGGNAVRIVTDFRQKENKENTVDDTCSNTAKSFGVASSANDKSIGNQIPINKASTQKQDATWQEQQQKIVVIDNKISAEPEMPILNKNTSYANDIAFVVLGGVGLTCIVGLGYGLYKGYQKIKATCF